MKKKKIKKIAKKIHKLVRDYNSQPVPEPINEYVDGYLPYDKEISDRFRKMIQNIIKWPDRLNVSVGENFAQIQIDDISQLKRGVKNISGSNKINEDNLLRIELKRGVGFCINYGYRNYSNHQDVTIFDELEEVLIEFTRQKNRDNFQIVWENIMRESGTLRDNNLNEILNG
jgi:hypothetical protein